MTDSCRHGRLIVVEGIDGSGKGTQTQKIRDALGERGLNVGSMTFPQYEANAFGGMIGRFLNGGFGPLDAVAPELSALLFAGDRFESKPQLLSQLEGCDVVVLDRYVASNIAHQAGRVDGKRREDLIRFLAWLEFELYGLPEPDLTVWLDLPVEIARKRVALKAAREYTDREADIQEEDLGHLARASAVYEQLASSSGWARIDTVPDGVELSEGEVTDRILTAVDTLF